MSNSGYIISIITFIYPIFIQSFKKNRYLKFKYFWKKKQLIPEKLNRCIATFLKL